MAKMPRLKWEPVDQNMATTISRAKVPWGWILLAVDDVYKIDSPHSYLIGPGYEWRTSITFMFDPFHWWK